MITWGQGRRSDQLKDWDWHTHTTAAAAAAAKSLQLCPTLYDSIDGSPQGPPAPGILQARTLEWAAISSSNEWKGKVKVKSLSRVRLRPWDFPGKSTDNTIYKFDN